MVVVGNNDFLGNKEDALCREPQTRSAHSNRFAFCYQEGQTAECGFISCKQKADNCMASELVSQKHNTTQ